ncbi:MAG: glycosyltransferase [Flavobacteriales bacterium]
MNHRILFLSYWSLREPLNAAAVFPYLHLLSERPGVEHVLLVTLETTDTRFQPSTDLCIPKVEHRAIGSHLWMPASLSRIEQLWRGWRELVRMVREERISLIIAKGSMAGAVAHLVHKRTNVPYSVESFEPHSIYMAECGEWSTSGLRYKVAHHFELLEMQHARHVMTVTDNHRNDLLAEGHDPERIHMIPSITDLEHFKFDPMRRTEVRQVMGLTDADTLGIYVGKFGGLYYDDEAFMIFRRMSDHFPGAHVLVLSPMDPIPLRAKARKAGIPDDRFHVRVVPHPEVPAYLSAADLAFSTIKPAPIKRYQCPIKNGEYWANGLPILMTDGIADDHVLMRKGEGGHVFQSDFSDLDTAFEGVRTIMMRPGHRVEIAGLARRYKSLDIARAVYDATL